MFGIDVRVARAVYTAVVVVAAFYCVYVVRSTLLLAVFAVFFSYLVMPLVEAGERRFGGHVPRDLIIALAFALVLGLVALVGGVFGATIATQAVALVEELPQLLDPATLGERLPLPGLLEPFRDRLAALVRDMVQGAQPQALATIQRIGAGVVTAAGHLLYAVVIPVFSFLMIRRLPTIQAQLQAWATRSKRTVWAGLAMDINLLLAHYVRALV